MRNFTLLFLFVLIFQSGFCRQINADEAKDIALRFSSTGVKLNSSTATQPTLKQVYKAGDAESPYYYVFNREANSGYVIVSGDDSVEGVLGYSDSGRFDTNNIPDNMRAWLEDYQAQIEFARNNNLPSSTQVIDKATSDKSVSPLLGSTAWNQSTPYNDKCPTIGTTKTYTGCVATAMAQIMYYHKYPTKGTGTKTLTLDNKNYTADFANTTYAWADMTPTYNDGSTQAACEAVATLMLHCGIAAHMNYGTNSSGAQTPIACNGLVENFNYDAGLQLIPRDYYSRDDWEAILKAELDARRPIMYGGNSTSGGHQFVCDGYDTNGFFHINWGWSGMSDGYFKISALTPSGQGIGGSTGGFNYSQNAAVGIRPNNNTTNPHAYTLTNDGLSVEKSNNSLGGEVDLNITRLTNNGYGDFGGYLGIGFKNVITGEIEKVVNPSSFNLGSNYLYQSYSIKATIPTSFNGSDYYMCLMSHVNTSDDWEEVRTVLGGSRVMMGVNGSKVVFSSSEAEVSLRVESLEVEEVYAQVPFGVKCNITNFSDEEYYAALKVRILNSNNTTVYTGKEVIEDINPGETMEVNFTENLSIAAGTYYITILDKNGEQLIVPTQVIVRANQGAPKLTLTSIKIDNINSIPKDKVVAKITVKNTGGTASVPFMFSAYSATTGTFLDLIRTSNTRVTKDETTELEISGSLDLENNKYLGVIHYMWDNQYVQLDTSLGVQNPFYFTLTDAAGVELTTDDSNNVVIYPNPAENVVNIQATGEVGQVKIFDLSGKRVAESHNSSTIDVSSLAPGSYIMTMVIDGKTQVKPLLKK